VYRFFIFFCHDSVSTFTLFLVLCLVWFAEYSSESIHGLDDEGLVRCCDFLILVWLYDDSGVPKWVFGCAKGAFPTLNGKRADTDQVRPVAWNT